MGTFKIIRMFKRHDYAPRLVVKRGLTMEEAQEHCRNKNTSSSTASSPAAKAITKKHGPWFDAYEEEK